MTVQNHKYNFSIKREKRKLACFSEREKNRPKVNGKEFDGMHGLNTYDYGARQYNPVTGRWDRMDPHSENYYPHSQYAYCNNTPMNAIDPDGKDDYRLNAAGQFEFWRKSNAKTTDRIYTYDGNSNITINKATTKQLMSDRDDYDGNYAVGGAEMQEIFKFCSDNTNVEWRLNSYKTPNGEKEVLMTTHEWNSVISQNNIGGMKERNLMFSAHSHPDNHKNPSGFNKEDAFWNKNGDLYMYPGDRLTAWKTSNRVEGYGKKAPRFYMYHPATQTLVRYDKDRIRTRTKVSNGKLHF